MWNETEWPHCVIRKTENPGPVSAIGHKSVTAVSARRIVALQSIPRENNHFSYITTDGFNDARPQLLPPQGTNPFPFFQSSREPTIGVHRRQARTDEAARTWSKVGHAQARMKYVRWTDYSLYIIYTCWRGRHVVHFVGDVVWCTSVRR